LKKSSIKYYLLLLVSFGYNYSVAQDNNYASHNVNINIPEVAVLDLESFSGTTINLSPQAPSEAGKSIDFSSARDNSIWLNYSSVVGSMTEPSRNVTVQITSGSVPNGVNLTLQSSTDAGRGEGTMGTPIANSLVLDNSPQNIIKDIGSAYTGDGVYSGHNLTYKLNKKPGEFGQLDFDQNNSITISYTLTDN